MLVQLTLWISQKKKTAKAWKCVSECVGIPILLNHDHKAFISLDKSEFLDKENNNEEQVLFVSLNFCVTS